jgi:transcriptional regulator with XRE-family HTH domain
MTAAESLDPDESLWNAIAFHLRFERQKRGMSQSEVGRIIGVNKHAVSNLEAGRNKLTQYQAEKLDEAWQTGGLFTRLCRFAKLIHDPNWRARLDRYQREAVQLKLFHGDFIPLPFQTEDYGRGLLGSGYAAGLVDDLEAAVTRRMGLQSVMLEGKSGPPLIWAVLDEAALRPMAEPTIMKAQFEHMIKLSEFNHVSIRVLPLTAAPHIGIDGPFWLFDLPGRKQVAFAGTTLDVGKIIDDPGEIAGVTLRFDRIAARALNEEQTRDLLLRMTENL